MYLLTQIELYDQVNKQNELTSSDSDNSIKKPDNYFKTRIMTEMIASSGNNLRLKHVFHKINKYFKGRFSKY